MYSSALQTTGVVVSLGVGVMLIVTVALLERSLDRHIDLERRREVPSFFFVDIQQDQADGFMRTVSEINGDRPALTPVIRSRLAAINGRPIERARADGHERAWLFTREYLLTIGDAVPAANVVTRGRWSAQPGTFGTVILEARIGSPWEAAGRLELVTCLAA